jgi:hypothetical protein
MNYLKAFIAAGPLKILLMTLSSGVGLDYFTFLMIFKSHEYFSKAVF